MSIGPVSTSKAVSLITGAFSDARCRLSCLEMALKAGLRICDELRESEREPGELMWVMIDSCGPARDLFFQRRDIEPNLLLNRWLLVAG